MTKFNFKTFNRNVSALQVPPNVQSLLRELIETINLHGAVIEQLATAAESSAGAELSTIPDAVDPPMDDLDQILHEEVFGKDP